MQEIASKQDAGELSGAVLPPLARVCVPTWRRFSRRAFQCSLYEAQDVLQQTHDVDLIPIEARSGFPAKETRQRRLLYHDVTRRLIFRNPGLNTVSLKPDRNVFIAVLQSPLNFFYLNAVQGWEECKTKICWVDEIWTKHLPRYKYWLHAFKRFDHVFVGSSGSVDAFSECIGKQCHWLPGAVDALRFSPYPACPDRVIDVYSIGRRMPGVHNALVQMADRGRIFYAHDTASGADMDTFDHQQHRTHLANMIKRSRCFMVGPGKLDDALETGGQIEFGARFYEGATAGAVMLGQAPKLDAFQKMFGWRDAVIELKPDGSDVAGILSHLAADPEWANQIRRRNAREGLLRHDWIYRWMEVFRVAGISPSPGMLARQQSLRDLAATIS